MGRFQIDGRGAASLKGRFPTGHANAPAVARFQAGESPFRHWRDQIVSIEHGKIEEFLSHLDTNGVKPYVVGTGAAIPVAIKSCERIATTATQFSAENIGRHGG